MWFFGVGEPSTLLYIVTNFFICWFIYLSYSLVHFKNDLRYHTRGNGFPGIYSCKTWLWEVFLFFVLFLLVLFDVICFQYSWVLEIFWFSKCPDDFLIPLFDFFIIVICFFMPPWLSPFLLSSHINLYKNIIIICVLWLLGPLLFLLSSHINLYKNIIIICLLWLLGPLLFLLSSHINLYKNIIIFCLLCLIGYLPFLLSSHINLYKKYYNFLFVMPTWISLLFTIFSHQPLWKNYHYLFVMPTWESPLFTIFSHKQVSPLFTIFSNQPL